VVSDEDKQDEGDSETMATVVSWLLVFTEVVLATRTREA